ncbi:MAG: hypothetical protein Q8L04_06610 [Ignavibacteria bacterium]|nr:hypothetical protein [Ignavibacteria bacterium]
MKSFSKIFISLCLIALFSGCVSQTGFQYISPEFLNKAEQNTTVLILPVNFNSLIHIQEDSIEQNCKVYASATVLETEIFDNYINIILGEKTQTKIITKENLQNEKELKLENKSAFLGGRKVEFAVPSNVIKSKQSEQIDFILLFDNLSFLKNMEIDGSSLGRSGESTYLLNAGIEYIIWSNKLKKIAGYGELSQKIKLLFAPQKEDYIAIIEKLADVIIQKSPFAAKKIYF